jgi:hypothetical protein
LRRIKDVKQHVYRRHKQPDYYLHVVMILSRLLTRGMSMQGVKASQTLSSISRPSVPSAPHRVLMSMASIPSLRRTASDTRNSFSMTASSIVSNEGPVAPRWTLFLLNLREKEIGSFVIASRFPLKLALKTPCPQHSLVEVD